MKRVIYPDGLKTISTTITENDFKHCKEHKLQYATLIREKVQEHRFYGSSAGYGQLKKKFEENAMWMQVFTQQVVAFLEEKMGDWKGDQYKELIDRVAKKIKKEADGKA